MNFITRTTLCVSTVFAVVRCPSVCPSVTLVHCMHTAEDIVTLLAWPGSLITLVFITPCADTQFQEEPFQHGFKVHGVGKFRNFRPKSSFISETVRNRPVVTMER